MSQEENRDNPLAEIVAAHGGKIPTPEELAERRAFDEIVRSIDDVGDYVPEEEDPNVLIYGPWLERGGSAFWVSTAGTGKSIGSFQLAHAMSMGRPFCGLRPRGRLKFWIFQSEDSERRNAQDRIDVRAELVELYGDEDTAEAWRGIKLIKLTGKVGTEFLAELDKLLGQAEGYGAQPDVIILNPFLAFVGGPITDGAYVTPFLRGGMIDGEHTC
ncbi:MAG: AAA family ATPase, partial [Kiritimatiellae bacterium]|nr:AAA family ATPase [Kiritimatiellia bacterium]